MSSSDVRGPLYRVAVALLVVFGALWIGAFAQGSGPDWSGRQKLPQHKTTTVDPADPQTHP